MRMIGERTKTLFKLWGTGAAFRPKSMNTMESYCSHATSFFPEGFDVTSVGGIVKSVAELQGLLAITGNMANNLAGDARAAVRAIHDFVQWLIDEGKFDCQFEVLLEELEEASQYNFQESYRDFFNTFRIDEEALIDYAMRPDVSYFASSEAAMASWNDLKGRLLNGQRIFIRNNNNLFRLFYEEVFNNANVVGDQDGNTEPIKALGAVTGVTTRSQDPRLRVLINYKLSHIYARPNNPLMFSGVYNFAFTPTMVDAFTEEAQGAFSIRFRHVFREFAYQRFGEIYSQFKQFVLEHDIDRRIELFNPQGYTTTQMAKFRQMAHADWSPFFEIPD